MDKLKVFKSLVKNDISGTSPPIKEFEDDPVWHARKLVGSEILIGKKRLGLK